MRLRGRVNIYLIENNMNDQFKKLAESPKIYDISDQIGNEFGLHIDQISEIDSAIRSVLFGDTDSRDFVKNIQKRLECDTDMAVKISKRVNELVFSVIKDLLQQESNDQTNQDEVSIVKPENNIAPDNQSSIQNSNAVDAPKDSSINLIQKDYGNSGSVNEEKKEEISKVQSVSATPLVPQKNKTDLEKVGQFDLEHDGHAPELHENDTVVVDTGHEIAKSDGITFEKNYSHEMEDGHLPNVSKINRNVEAVPNQLIAGNVSSPVPNDVKTEVVEKPQNSPQIITEGMEKMERNKIQNPENTVSIPPKYEKKSYSSDPYRESIE